MTTAASAPAGATIGADTLLVALETATDWLERNAATVNALNVFPVPDGDTGTNMLLTMRSAVAGARNGPADSAGVVMRSAAHGAVMGARGNSGVILSQIIAGLAAGLAARPACDGHALAGALTQGADAAYGAVTRPVEGTILTVARAAGDAALALATERAGQPLGCAEVVGCAHAAAQVAVERTQEQMPLLRQAGVVDAGGEGYRLILEGIDFSLRGEQLPEFAGAPPLAAAGTAGASAMPVVAVDIRAIPSEEWGYCTQFLISGENLDLAQVRDTLQSIADSTLVVGDDTVLNVHGHTDDPGSLLSTAIKYGRLGRILIEDMDAQHDEWLRGQVERESATGLGGQMSVDPERAAGDGSDAAGSGPAAAVATIAVAPGSGLADVFRSLGVAEIVPGGQSMNPSVQEIIDAARRTGAQTVIVLPNNGNVVSTAQHAARLTGDGPELLVVPTRTVPQGIGAQLAFDPTGAGAENTTTMAEAAASVRTVEITHATRAAQIDGVDVRQGDVLALLDDRLVAAAADPLAAALPALEQAKAGEAEIVTVYRGAAVSAADAEAFVTALKSQLSGPEVESVAGGQPHYDYIISVE